MQSKVAVNKHLRTRTKLPLGPRLRGGRKKGQGVVDAIVVTCAALNSIRHREKRIRRHARAGVSHSVFDPMLQVAQRPVDKHVRHVQMGPRTRSKQRREHPFNQRSRRRHRVRLPADPQHLNKTHAFDFNARDVRPASRAEALGRPWSPRDSEDH